MNDDYNTFEVPTHIYVTIKHDDCRLSELYKYQISLILLQVDIIVKCKLIKK